MNIKDTIAAINQMQADGVIEGYAIGGALGATFCLEPVATTTGMKQKDGELPWSEVCGRVQTPWRKELHRDFERALAEAKPPEHPDCEAANRFLVNARREMATTGKW